MMKDRRLNISKKAKKILIEDLSHIDVNEVGDLLDYSSNANDEKNIEWKKILRPIFVAYQNKPSLFGQFDFIMNSCEMEMKIWKKYFEYIYDYTKETEKCDNELSEELINMFYLDEYDTNPFDQGKIKHHYIPKNLYYHNNVTDKQIKKILCLNHEELPDEDKSVSKNDILCKLFDMKKVDIDEDYYIGLGKYLKDYEEQFGVIKTYEDIYIFLSNELKHPEKYREYKEKGCGWYHILFEQNRNITKDGFKEKYYKYLLNKISFSSFLFKVFHVGNEDLKTKEEDDDRWLSEVDNELANETYKNCYLRCLLEYYSTLSFNERMIIIYNDEFDKISINGSANEINYITLKNDSNIYINPTAVMMEDQLEILLYCKNKNCIKEIPIESYISQKKFRQTKDCRNEDSIADRTIHQFIMSSKGKYSYLFPITEMKFTKEEFKKLKEKLRDAFRYYPYDELIYFGIQAKELNNCFQKRKKSN